MPILETIISSLSNGLLKGVGDILDKFITTDAERDQAKKEITQVLIKAEADAQDQLTERLRIDMNSDSWLAKNIRPLTLIFVMAMFTVFAFTDGNIGGFTVGETYIKAFGEFITMIIMFYFGSRGVEKIMDTVGKYQIGSKKSK